MNDRQQDEQGPLAPRRPLTGPPGSPPRGAGAGSDSQTTMAIPVVNNAPPQPQVRVASPGADHRRHCLPVRPQHVAHPVRHLVDVVPPGAGDDHLAMQVEQLQPADGLKQAGEPRGGVALLAKDSLSPQHRRGVAQVVELTRPALGSPTGEPADHRNPHAKVGHRRFHVRLHLGRTRRVGLGAQDLPDGGHQLGVDAHGRLAGPRA